MFRDTVIEIFKNVWPMLLITSMIVVSLRTVYLISNKKPFVFYQELLMFGFIIYVICLFYVVTFQDVSWSTSNFIPFKEMFRYPIFSRLFIRNVVGNILIFIPYGFFASYFLKVNKKSILFFLSLFTSVTIETTQLVIGRVFDIDDILLNVVGGMLGFFLYQSFILMKDHLPSFLKTEWFYNIIVSVILLIMGLYLLKFIEVGV